jgi:hypothetical protein
LTLDDGIGSDLVWSSDDGRTVLRFPPQARNKPARLARTFPGDRLQRVLVDALPQTLQHRSLLHLGCSGGSSVEWGPCADDSCSVTASYRVPRMYRAWRSEHWTTPTRAPAPYDDWPDVHYSRFKQRIAWRKAGDPEIERQSVRFTRDIVADLRDCLAAACVGGRCAEPLHVAERQLRAYVGGRDPRYVLSEHGKAYDRWNTGWMWDASAGGTTLKTACVDISESRQVFCSVELALGGGLRLIFFPRNAASTRGFDVIIVDGPGEDEAHAVGKLAFQEGPRRDGAAWVAIGGRALALAPDGQSPSRSE